MTAITSSRDKVRVLIGDTDSSAPLFPDDQLDYFLDERGDNVLLAAADACESAAVRFARAYDFSVDGQSFSRSAMQKMFLEMAKQYRTRATGIGTQAATRVDGYSQSIDAQRVSAAGTADSNPRQDFYIVEGIDRLP